MFLHAVLPSSYLLLLLGLINRFRFTPNAPITFQSHNNSYKSTAFTRIGLNVVVCAMYVWLYFRDRFNAHAFTRTGKKNCCVKCFSEAIEQHVSCKRNLVRLNTWLIIIIIIMKTIIIESRPHLRGIRISLFSLTRKTVIYQRHPCLQLANLMCVFF